MAESHTQQLAEIMAKIAKLPSSNLEPPQFFANFLQLTIAVTGSEGGAIWVLQPEQGPQCYCHLNLELCGIKEPDQQRLIVEAIGRTVKEEKTLVLPGLQGDGNGKNVTNQCPHPLFFKPLMAANKVAMLVQLIGPANLDDQNVRPMVGLLDQASEAAEVFLAHRRATVLDDDRKALTKLLQYAESVHNSLEPEKVVYQIANQGRDTIDCDRVIIWVNPKIKRGLRAVSGIDKPDRRAVLMQAAEKLSKHCLELKKPIVASRGQLAELPEEDKLTILLTDYFNVSQLDQVYLQPIMHNETYLGVLIAEGFDEQSTANLGGVISAVATHGATALANALDVAALPIMRPLARIKKASHEPKTKRKWQIAIVLLVTVAAVLCFLPWTVQIHCTCELMPKNLRRIESSLMDVKIEQILKADGNVNAGDVIARLDALDLRTELASLQLARNQEEVKRDTALTDTDRKISVLEIQRLDSNIALINEQIGLCEVKSPITGTILTPRLDLKVGQTVKKGDLICEVADLTIWQLVLDVPQEEVDWVRRGITAGNDQGGNVQFFLLAYPQYKLQTKIDDVFRIGQRAQIKDEGNVFEVRIDVDGAALKVAKEGLSAGMIGQAKIATVSKPLGYVMLRKVIRFFRVTFF